MSAAHQLRLVPIQEYLDAELDSPVKHEYVAGVLYAMSGGRNVHNQVATNTTAALWAGLRGQRCRAFNSDTKVRIKSGSQTRFYYPDAQVVCEANAPDEVFQDRPVVVVEVLSDSTRRIDMGEKLEAYLGLPSLAVYLLVETVVPAVVAFRRIDQGFQREVWDGLDTVIPLPEVGMELRLSDLYDGVF